MYKETIALLRDERKENDAIQKRIEEQNAKLKDQEVLINKIKTEKAETERLFVEDPELNSVMRETQNLNQEAEYANVERKLIQVKGAAKNAADANIEYANSNKKISESHTKTAKTFDGFLGKFISSQIIFQKLKQLYRETIRTIQELDAAFNGIAIVTQYSTKEV